LITICWLSQVSHHLPLLVGIAPTLSYRLRS
jgi:hypothetical protein